MAHGGDRRLRAILELRAPGTPALIHPEKASYRDSYRTSAAFLGYLTLTHDKSIITKLNAAMRRPDASESMFKTELGRPVEDLWKDFLTAGAPNSPEAQKAWWDAEQAKKTDTKK